MSCDAENPVDRIDNMRPIPDPLEADVVIVGSGAGGSMVARELARRKIRVIVVERGRSAAERMARRSLAGRIYGKLKGASLLKSLRKRLGHLTRPLAAVHSGGLRIPIGRRIGLGGATTLTSGNAVRCLESELHALGVDVSPEFAELERQLHVAPLPEELMGRGAKRLLAAARSLGYDAAPMPKCIDFRKCVGCGRCCSGCPTGAKWSAVEFLDDAKTHGSVLLEGVKVNEVIVSNGIGVGVRGTSRSGVVNIWGKMIVLAAGAIDTAVILQRSGIDEAGQKFFCDPYYHVYGPDERGGYDCEMRAILTKEFVAERGFLLTNAVVWEDAKGPGPRGNNGMLGILLKIKDSSVGKVRVDGTTDKSMTAEDLARLEDGKKVAEEILSRASLDRQSLRLRGPEGVHPGGTAAIGEVVDRFQETEIKNVFVSDASVLPEAPGLPPILTILALSKRLAAELARRL